ncbi:MAG: VOC family protein [Xanthomonadales bacterium]|nr:VOC family protein [Xanthomonadales bacterium]
MELGEFSVSLTVKDMEASLAFYRRLGFEVVDGGHLSREFPDSDEHQWRIVSNDSTRIGLFQGMFPHNMLTFHPADIEAVRRDLAASGALKSHEAQSHRSTIMLEDPDGNLVMMDGASR